MIDLRFVERHIPIIYARDIHISPDTQLTRMIRVLQWRQCDNGLEVINGLQKPLWSSWEDVRQEDE